MTNYSLTTAPVPKQGESPLAVAVHERNLNITRSKNIENVML